MSVLEFNVLIFFYHLKIFEIKEDKKSSFLGALSRNSVSRIGSAGEDESKSKDRRRKEVHSKRALVESVSQGPLTQTARLAGRLHEADVF